MGQAELDLSAAFAPFAGINAAVFNLYTLPRWRAAVAAYEHSMAAAEQKVALKLRQLFHGLRVRLNSEMGGFLSEHLTTASGRCD